MVLCLEIGKKKKYLNKALTYLMCQKKKKTLFPWGRACHFKKKSWQENEAGVTFEAKLFKSASGLHKLCGQQVKNKQLHATVSGLK